MILVLISFQGQCDGDLEGTTVISGEILGPLSSLWEEVKSGAAIVQTAHHVFQGLSGLSG